MSDKVRRAGKPVRRSFLIFSIGLVAFVSGLIACNDAPSTPTAPQLGAAATARKGSVGEGHNAMVDAVLRDVAKKRAKGSEKKLCKLVEESAIEYARSTARNPGEAVSIIKKQEFCVASGLAARTAGMRAGLYEEYGLSPRATELLNSANYFLSVSYSAGALQSYLNSINAAAISELDWEEAQVVTSATSVAVSSFDYWNANLAYWQTTLTEGPGSVRSDVGFGDVRLTPMHSFWGGVWDVTKADLEGAIGGGVMARLAKAAIPEYAMWMGGSKSLISVINLM
ncbi:MAG: hypothetical protein H0U64_03100 [Gemmatimonadaceae bacterium]|nr:hypothetical protein [Gemmatimonadaceae bacterium]